MDPEVLHDPRGNPPEVPPGVAPERTYEALQPKPLYPEKEVNGPSSIDAQPGRLTIVFPWWSPHRVWKIITAINPLWLWGIPFVVVVVVVVGVTIGIIKAANSM